jgi:hypothetical protein
MSRSLEGDGVVFPHPLINILHPAVGVARIPCFSPMFKGNRVTLLMSINRSDVRVRST